jgi:hypothetical protein
LGNAEGGTLVRFALLVPHHVVPAAVGNVVELSGVDVDL